MIPGDPSRRSRWRSRGCAAPSEPTPSGSSRPRRATGCTWSRGSWTSLASRRSATTVGAPSRRARQNARRTVSVRRSRSGAAHHSPTSRRSRSPSPRSRRWSRCTPRALEDRIEADLLAGRHGELVPELEALVARHPFRERLRGQLMLALYRVGRQGDALAAYREAVRTLDTELGLRPWPELERLERAILAQDRALERGPPAADDVAPDTRRATATVLFTDIVGSTRLRSELGDEEADSVRREHDRRVRDVIAAHDGREVKALGDGFLAVFDSAGAAIACARDVQRAIDRQAHHGPVSVAVRVGIGAGDVAWEAGDVFGTPVVEAQRLCAAAGPGEILAADAVRLLAGTAAREALEDAGELTLRGLVHPVRAWRVSWAFSRTVEVALAAALAFEGAVDFAGREAPVAALREAWSDACDGRRRGVFVTGEPGMGEDAPGCGARCACEPAGRRRPLRPLRRRTGRARAAVRGGVVRLRGGLPARRAARAAGHGGRPAADPADVVRATAGHRRCGAGTSGGRAAPHAGGDGVIAAGGRRDAARAARARRPPLGRGPVAPARSARAPRRRANAPPRDCDLPRLGTGPLAAAAGGGDGPGAPAGRQPARARSADRARCR